MATATARILSAAMVRVCDQPFAQACERAVAVKGLGRLLGERRQGVEPGQEVRSGLGHDLGEEALEGASVDQAQHHDLHEIGARLSLFEIGYPGLVNGKKMRQIALGQAGLASGDAQIEGELGLHGLNA